MGLQSAARGPHVALQVVLYNPRSHLNCVYTIKITQIFSRLCETLGVNFLRAAREPAHMNHELIFRAI